MGALFHFSEALRDSIGGEPGERRNTIEVFSFERHTHLRVVPVKETRPIVEVLLSLGEARELAEALESSARRLSVIGEP